MWCHLKMSKTKKKHTGCVCVCACVHARARGVGGTVNQDYTLAWLIVKCILGVPVAGSPSGIYPEEIIRNAQQDSKSFFTAYICKSKTGSYHGAQRHEIGGLDFLRSAAAEGRKTGTFSLNKPMNERVSERCVKNISREISTKYSHGKPHKPWEFRAGRKLRGIVSGHLPQVRKKRSGKPQGAQEVLV